MKNDVKPGEQRGGERRNDLEGERLRVERDERRDEHAEAARDDAREHGVHDREAARREPGEHRRDLVLRRRPRGQSERRPPEERRQHRRDDDHDPREQEPVLGTTRSKIVTVSGGEDRRRRLQAVAEDHDHAASRTSRRPSDAASLASGAVFRSGRKIASSISDAEHGHADEREREGRHGRELEAEVAGLERPEEVRGEHRDRAGGDVDDPGAAVDQDDAERDARDQRARTEPQRRVEEDVLHPAQSSQRAAGPGSCRAHRPSVFRVYFAPGGFSQVDGDLPLAFAHVVVELGLVAAGGRLAWATPCRRRHSAAARTSGPRKALNPAADRRRGELRVRDRVHDLHRREQRLPGALREDPEHVSHVRAVLQALLQVELRLRPRQVHERLGDAVRPLRDVAARVRDPEE